MKTTLLGMSLALATAVTAVMPASRALAQGMEGPAIVVGLAPVKEQLADIAYITRAAGQEEAGGLVNLLAGEYVRPLDQGRPAGAYVSIGQFEPMVVVFLPVKDMDGLIELVSDSFTEPEMDGDYYMFPSPDGDTVYVIQKGDWAFVSNQKAALSDTPDDPSELLAGLEGYNLAVRVHGQNVPEPLKAMAIDAMQEGFDSMLAELERTDPDQADLQRQLNQASLDNMSEMINDMDEFTIGWSIDAQEKGTYFDVMLTGLEGSAIAESSARLEGVESSFSGFMVDGSALNLGLVSLLSEDDIRQTIAMITNLSEKAISDMENDPGMNPMEVDLATSMLTSLTESLNATIETGKLDGGMSIVLEEESAALIAGGHVLETAQLEQAVKDLIAQVRDDAPPGVEFNLDLRKVDGVNYHQIVIPVPEGEEEARAIFGEELELWLGVAPEAMYLAAGKNAETLLADAIANSGQGEARDHYLEANFDLSKLIEFGARVQDEPQMQMMADVLQGKEAKIMVYGEVIENGAMTRIMIKEGIISALGQGIEQAMGAIGGSGGAEF